MDTLSSITLDKTNSALTISFICWYTKPNLVIWKAMMEDNWLTGFHGSPLLAINLHTKISSKRSSIS